MAGVEGLDLACGFSGALGHGWAGVIVSIMSCCVTNQPTPKLNNLKTTNIYHHRVSEDQEFGSRLAGWYWPEVSGEGAVIMGLTGVEGSTYLLLRWLTCVAVGWRPQFLATWTAP